ncbi:GIY-YIG nuclease family protein [Nocardia nova]|uniref:GIY-YIG nuclease family protein n=1 Tax=Nocardia nova TaxID=37330 RepID=UPI000CEA0A83|nr:GIY-YIG nuclease family protein [Nocardia nova]PPI89215.1 hypothetical protein C5E46_34405 [Nocardia nova]
MGYIYAFRLGQEDLFKIGQTTMTPEKRRRTLQTGCPHELVLFDVIETDEYKATEKYIKDFWGEYRGEEGGTEIYRFTAAQAAEVFTGCRGWLANILPLERKAEELAGVEPDPTVLPRDDKAVELREEWLELDRRERELLESLRYVSATKDCVEAELKVAIGTASGIEGVATWEQTLESRRVNPELVKATDPELYEQCLVPRFDSARLKTLLKTFGQHDYESFQEVRRSREFRIAG